VTYLALNALFFVPVLVLAVVALRVHRRRGRAVPWAALASTGLVLLVATTVFDNILIALDIVDYDHDLTLGLRVGIAPVEDYAYSLAALVGLPSLWVLLSRPARSPRDHDGTDDEDLVAVGD